jgi:hypothetical protein
MGKSRCHKGCVQLGPLFSFASDNEDGVIEETMAQSNSKDLSSDMFV